MTPSFTATKLPQNFQANASNRYQSSGGKNCYSTSEAVLSILFSMDQIWIQPPRIICICSKTLVLYLNLKYTPRKICFTVANDFMKKFTSSEYLLSDKKFEHNFPSFILDSTKKNVRKIGYKQKQQSNLNLDTVATLLNINGTGYNYENNFHMKAFELGGFIR
jgi:hypothetical protein